MLCHFKCIYSVAALHYHSHKHSISQQNVRAALSNENGFRNISINTTLQVILECIPLLRFANLIQTLEIMRKTRGSSVKQPAILGKLLIPDSSGAKEPGVLW